MADLSLIDSLMKTHDDDPQGAAAALRALLPGDVAAGDLARATWLINHVIGEKEGAWEDAYAMVTTLTEHNLTASSDSLITASGLIQIARNKAVAAGLSHRDADLRRATVELIDRSGSNDGDAQLAIALGQMEFTIASAHVSTLYEQMRGVLELINGSTPNSPLARMIAASLNNTVSGLLDHPDPLTSDLDIATLNDGAAKSLMIWTGCGTWVNQERALYLVALCANKTAQWTCARDAAQRALAIIESNGSEDVDRAFLLLELSHAQRELEELDLSRASRSAAELIAAGFNDPGLTQWFESRAALA